MVRSAFSSFLLALLLVACQAPSALVYPGFGNYERPINTSSAECQQLFNQGMQLLYGFNHDEAIRSFHAAAKADPLNPMPWWGIAYANGININDPAMSEQRSQDARSAADQALALLSAATPAEKAMIQAIDARYVLPIPADRKYLDQAYADAMESAYHDYPTDSDLGALYAESLMNLQAWDYWSADGQPRKRILEVVQVLESILDRDPRHPGANHFYIHATEASQNPDRAVAAADRLRNLVPGAGHLVHMPSHIYVRVGRYADAVDCNIDAVKADRSYFQLVPEQNFYALYYGHNLHFLAYSAMMSGRYADAIRAARDLEAEVPREALRSFAPIMEGNMPTTLHVLIRFGKWEQVLLEPEYADWRLVSRATYHYARAIAFSAMGRTAEARSEQELFFQAKDRIPEDWMVFNNKVSTVMPIAQAMMEGELLFREGNTQKAFETLRRGIAVEDTLVYAEPPGWMLPVRHALGALLMADGQASAAEQVYREDLARNRENGWALLGLQKALLAQGKTDLANALSERLVRAWAMADVTPSSSCYCEPGI